MQKTYSCLTISTATAVRNLSTPDPRSSASRSQQVPLRFRLRLNPLLAHFINVPASLHLSLIVSLHLSLPLSLQVSLSFSLYLYLSHSLTLLFYIFLLPPCLALPYPKSCASIAFPHRPASSIFSLLSGTVPEVKRFETSRSIIFNSVRQVRHKGQKDLSYLSLPFHSLFYSVSHRYSSSTLTFLRPT
jgi:hypothetical protein